MAPVPPSFSSFPDLAPKPPPKPKPPPPCFASFPSASTSTSEDRPSKRARATDFLDELSSELLSSTGGKEGRSHGREKERQRERDGEGERSEEREERRSSKAKGKEREREHRKKEKRSSGEKREEAVGSLDPMGRGRELEAVRGEFGQVSRAACGSVGGANICITVGEALEARQGSVGGVASCRAAACTCHGSSPVLRRQERGRLQHSLRRLAQGRYPALPTAWRCVLMVAKRETMS